MRIRVRYHFTEFNSHAISCMQLHIETSTRNLAESFNPTTLKGNRIDHNKERYALQGRQVSANRWQTIKFLHIRCPSDQLPLATLASLIHGEVTRLIGAFFFFGFSSRRVPVRWVNNQDNPLGGCGFLPCLWLLQTGKCTLWKQCSLSTLKNSHNSVRGISYCCIFYINPALAEFWNFRRGNTTFEAIPVVFSLFSLKSKLNGIRWKRIPGFDKWTW